MSKRYTKIYSSFFMAIIIMLFSVSTIFAANVIYSRNEEYNNAIAPVGNDITLAGDLYAQHFFNDEKNKGIVFYLYSAEGTTIEQNKERLRAAFESNNKRIFLSISVNDQLQNTHPSIFEKHLRDLLDISVETKKIVFTHTYMHYPWADYAKLDFPTYAYDSVIRKLSNEYPNVYYIDMSDCEAAVFSTGDGIHYSKVFNDILYVRLKNKMDEVVIDYGN